MIPWNKSTAKYETKACRTCGTEFTTLLRCRRVSCSRACFLKNNGTRTKGKPLSEENKAKLRAAHPRLRGSASPHWKGGITSTYRKRNRAKVAFWTRQRIYRRKSASGSHTYQQWIDLKARFGYKCLSCQRAEPDILLTADHIIPIVAGGTSNIHNIQPLCRSCNSRKWIHVIDYRQHANAI